MCTLAVWRRVSARYPLVVAANRDEFYARPARAPAPLEDVRGVVAGRDLEAGGTWLGCRVEGRALIAGVLNRRSFDGTAVAAPQALSRGRLCLDTLASASVLDALEVLRRTDVERFGSFNLLLVDLDRAVVVDNANGLRTTELGAGLSVLTNLEVNDPRCPRRATAVRAFEDVTTRIAQYCDVEAIVADCRSVLAGHENSLDPADASPFSRLCVHTELYGTRSSSVIAVARDGSVRYFHADGPPCRTALCEVKLPAGRLTD